MADILNQALKDANYGVSGKNSGPAVYYKITSYSMTRPSATSDTINYSIKLDAYMSKGGFMGAYSNMTLTLSMYAGANKEYTICSAKTIKSTSDSWSSSSDTSPVKSGITVSGTFTAANLSGDVPVWFITERTNGTTIGSGEVTNSSYTMNFPAKQPATYTIIYDANGGSNAPTSQVFNYDVSGQLSTQVPTRLGYKFMGWQDHNDYVLNGVTWHWYTFDAPYYANGSSDLLSAFGYDKYSLINHWMNTTLLGSENRTSSQKFNIAQYMNLYPALGSDKKACAIHWNDHGYNEGRYGVNNPIIDNNDVYPSGATVKNLSESNGATVILTAKWEPLPYSVNINNTWVPCTIKVNVIGEGYIYIGSTEDYQGPEDLNHDVWNRYHINVQGNEDLFYITRDEERWSSLADSMSMIHWWVPDYDIYMKSNNVKQWVGCELTPMISTNAYLVSSDYEFLLDSENHQLTTKG